MVNHQKNNYYLMINNLNYLMMIFDLILYPLKNYYQYVIYIIMVNNEIHLILVLSINYHIDLIPLIMSCYRLLMEYDPLNYFLLMINNVDSVVYQY